MPKAAVLPALEAPLELMDLTLGDPHAGEVRVRIAASGVCHSDLSVQNGTLFVPLPVVLGHEGAGVVEAVGDGVEHVKPGDHVILSWIPQCGHCFFCSHGQGSLCDASSTAMVAGGLLDGTSRFHTSDGTAVNQMALTGSFAESTVVPGISVVKIDHDIPLASAALIGCGVLTGFGAAVNTATIARGDTVAVVGCGGVGLNVIQGARHAGAERIIAVDKLDHKLDLARRFGATDTINIAASDAVTGVMDLTEERGADVAFEVIGLPQTIEQTINMARRGGQAILVGVPRMDVMVSVPAFLGVILAEKTIKGCWYGSSNVKVDIPKLTQLYRDGTIELDALISRTIGLDDVNDAFRALEAGEVTRTMIVFD